MATSTRIFTMEANAVPNKLTTLNPLLED